MQVTLHTGERFVSPLADLRADSVHLATTERRAARTVAKTDIQRLAYQDGKVFHGGQGALIGAVAGVALAAMRVTADTRHPRDITPREAAPLAALVGAGIGGFIGLAFSSPRWVDARWMDSRDNPE